MDTAEQSAARAVEAQVLARTDLPSVYSAVPVVERSVATRCGLPAETETAGRVAVAEVAYQNGTTQAHLQETVSRYEGGMAADLMATVRDLPRTCATFTEIQAGVQVTLRTADLAFPSLLDETVALKVTGNAGDTALAFDQVFMRHGDTLVVLVHGGTGTVDTATTEELARIAAKKVSEGPTTSTILPG